MWELDYKESWVPKNWCFWNVVLEKSPTLLRVPWTARRSSQSILKEISPGCSLKGPMLKLKLQYFGHLMWRVDWKRPWCWEGLEAGEEGDDRGWDGWMARWTDWMDMNLSKLWEFMMDREGWRAAIHGVAKSWAHLATELNWTELIQLFASPWTIAHQASLSMEFSRQEFWSGYHFLLHIQALALFWFFTHWKPQLWWYYKPRNLIYNHSLILSF